MRDYKRIKAWGLSDNLAVKIYDHTKHFPKDEMFALTSQMRRASYSVPANIAEGAGRRTNKDFLHFLDIAKGSINEVQYLIHLAGRLEYLESNEVIRLTEDADEVSKCLSGYIKAVESDV
ncbi:four helix bundle protein [bacterium E08(2017)]|nr:four helix bundle protein [bacterium E08(2017)]